MKKLIFIASLLGNVILLYQLNEDKKNLYDLRERSEFYKNKVLADSVKDE
ncbi:MAG TPA: hypothetical protein H9869_03880 [Candidatus Ligilactobacillus excrementipullorum]|nr:hypothetical protein [Candidatus Ligilactobacillus excrementipullorum]